MFVLFSLILTITIYLWYKGLQIYWKRKNVPFDKALPLLGNMGNTLFKIEHITETLQRMYNKHSDAKYFGFFNFQNPVIVIRDPVLLKMIAVKDFDIFHNHQSFVVDVGDPVWQKNLFVIQEIEKWRHMRATLSPSFTSSKMRMIFKLMTECSINFSNYYLQKDDVIKLDIKDAFQRYANDIIATTAFGITVDSLKHENNDFFVTGKSISNFSGIRVLKFFLFTICPSLMKALRIQLFDENISSFFKKIVKDNIRVREEQGIVRPDIIHLLMEARKGKAKKDTETVHDSSFAVVEEFEITRDHTHWNHEFTDDDITAQALIFFLAGFDTISTMMSFTAMELAACPDIQEKLVREVDELYERSGNNPSYEEILHLRYLDMVVSESLRKWPPVEFTDRKANRPYTLPPAKEGSLPCQLQKDFVVWIPIYPIHRDENYYPKPDSFDPERFSHENISKIKPFTYLPFGLGPRNCIGSRFALLEAKIIFYQILAKFEIVPVEETELPIRLDKNQFQPIPKGGFKIGLQKRLKQWKR